MITRKAYGGAYDVMALKLPAGDINSPGRRPKSRSWARKGAVEIIFREERTIQSPPARGGANIATGSPTRSWPLRPWLYRRRHHAPRRREQTYLSLAMLRDKNGNPAKARQHPAVSDQRKTMFKKILIKPGNRLPRHQDRPQDGHQDRSFIPRADKDALHVDLADEAVCIGLAASKESLSGHGQDHRRLQADRRWRRPPGYGFVREREFSRRLEEEGIKFIGPKHYSMAKMGDKIESKKLAIEAKVNTIPGHNDAIAGPDEAVAIAKKIGYPVMIKASAGVVAARVCAWPTTMQKPMKGFSSAQRSTQLLR